VTEPIRIRAVGPDDAPRLREIYLEARRDTFHWVDPSRYKLRDFDTDTAGEEMLLAQLEGQIAAFISWWAPERFIHHLYVDSRFRRRGVGRALLDACLARTTRPARLKCVVRNEAAFEFYLAQGWYVLETAVGNDGEYYMMQLGR
jgi:ribosomal protein S18 acetylase RimI-like enzyme